MIYPPKIMIKISITLVLVILIAIFADAGYTDLVIEDQLVKAINRGDFDFGLILKYLGPIVAFFCLIGRVWDWKPKK